MKNLIGTKSLAAFLEADEIEIRTGPFGTQLKASEYVDDGTPVINVRNIGLGSLRPEKLEYVPEKVASRLHHHRLRAGDIVFGRKGAVERHLLVRDGQAGWIQGSDCIRVRVNSGPLNPHFLSYCLLLDEHKSWIQSQASHGATMATLNQGIIERICVPERTASEQQRITNILSAYDDLVEVNQRRITILEDIAKRVFDEWFLRFRYPGHEAVPLVATELGMAPEGWAPARLGSLLTLSYGKALKADQRRAGPVPVYGSSGVVGEHDQHLVRGPGIIVGRKGNVGSVHWSSRDFYPIDTVFFVETAVPLRWVYQLLKRQTFLNSDAAVPGLNREQAYAMKVLRPAADLFVQYSDWVEPLFQQVEILTVQNVRLRAARDLLLPKLISGQIDVSSAEETFAEAAE